MTTRSRITRIAALVALAGTCVAVPAAARPVRGGGRAAAYHAGPTFEFVCEGGLAQPTGTQADPFGEGGYGAGTGYELGVRLRQYVSGNFSVSPAFHYVAFGSSRGIDNFPEGPNLGYQVATSLYRYSLDLQFWLGDPGAAVRPFLTGGVALAHNRYRDSLQYYNDFRTSMNGPSWTAGLGFKMGVLEITGAYVGNRFDTANLQPAGAADGTRSYNWDYAILSVGLAFGAY